MHYAAFFIPLRIAFIAFIEVEEGGLEGRGYGKGDEGGRRWPRGKEKGQTWRWRKEEMFRKGI